jgi:tetratricopeptide (TPR) repeat protein
MPVVSSIFFVAALVLAVVLGPQTRAWSWGPAMLALALAVAAALPAIWRRGKAQADFGLLALGALTAGWFGWRAMNPPVVELGQADLLLACGAVGAFITMRGIAGHQTAERVLAWGIALLLLASVVVVGMQLADPSYSPVFRNRAADQMISGFFAHYNEAANYFIASSVLVAAAAVFGRHHLATRIFWILIAIAGVASVWFTRSRGGILGVAVACGVFAALLLILGKRRNAKWFGPALIAVPVIGIGIGAFLLMGWQEAQEVRGQGSVANIFDNNARLYFLGIAFSCIGLHPMTGGGSRSFAWECFRFVDAKAQGDMSTHRPELVHNEWIQAATDYGLIGAGLLSGLLGALVILALIRVLFEDRPEQPDFRDAWRVGALAALAGMFVQSCFSFVFHLFPGVLLLGLCLGKLSRGGVFRDNLQASGSRILLTIAALVCIAMLVPAGWKGSLVMKHLWPGYFSKQGHDSDEARIEALAMAIQIWPQAAFFQERGAIYQEIATRFGDGPGFKEYAELAIEDYLEGQRLYPQEPSLVVNQANLLSQLGRDQEAEEAYARAIQLQGGMEPGFRGRFSLANHYLRKGLRMFDSSEPEASHEAMESAGQEIEHAVNMMHWIIADMREPRVSIHESLGTAREAVGDRTGALEAYNFAASLPGGTRAHYRAGVLLGKTGVDLWSKRRPSEALSRFMEARKRVGQAGNQLPQGVSLSDRVEYLDYLDRTIAFLKGAKVEPE